jgi:cellulose synthase/poly-beta-1,6-N-acetylglucosamine synthase-like glycosyltransferase
VNATISSTTTYLSWMLIGCGALTALFFTIIAARVAQVILRAPRVGDGLAVAAPSDGWPLVSIIVPAHNEERVIEACVTSLLASD